MTGTALNEACNAQVTDNMQIIWYNSISVSL